MMMDHVVVSCWMIMMMIHDGDGDGDVDVDDDDVANHLPSKIDIVTCCI